MKILYEDTNYIAIDKPSGVLVYNPAHILQNEQTLIDEVGGHLDFKEKGERNGIVHRLDRDTSGVIIFAKNKKSEKLLKEIFKNREIKKHYLTLVHGRVEPREGRINIPLGRASKERLKIVPSPSGKASETLYRVKKYFPSTDLSLLEVELKTGRMHQIRVHFSAIGHPVVGDKLYGRKTDRLKRQFLHAERIEFREPFNNKDIVIDSSLSKDLNLFLKSLS